MSGPAPSTNSTKSRRKKTSAEPTPAVGKASRTRSKRYSGQDKVEMLGQIDAQLANGTTLKDAVKSLGISDQTYYQWKKAAKSADKVEATPAGEVDDLAEFTELEAENARLRKLLAEKLRAENAELRRRLGL
ncbi:MULTISPECIES: transposase [Rhizobium]|nr:transposase [Rhizobium paranaense]